MIFSEIYAFAKNNDVQVFVHTVGNQFIIIIYYYYEDLDYYYSFSRSVM